MLLPRIDLAELESELEPDSEAAAGKTKYAMVGKYRVEYQDYDPKTRHAFLDFNDRSKPRNITGWKFHIAVVPAQREQACDIIVDELSRHGIKQFKLANTRLTIAFTQPGKGQRGKILTVYYQGEPGLLDAMHNIEKRLHAAGIKPGFPVKHDRKVKGSCYLYYRNDRDRDGEYIAANQLAAFPEEQHYNPYNAPDPFAGFDVRAIHEVEEKALADAPTADTAHVEQTSRLLDLLTAYHDKEQLCGVKVVKDERPYSLPVFVAPINKLPELQEIEAGLALWGIKTVREWVPKSLGFPENEARNMTPILRICTESGAAFEHMCVRHGKKPWQDTVVLDPKNYIGHKTGWAVFSRGEGSGFADKAAREDRPGWRK